MAQNMLQAYAADWVFDGERMLAEHAVLVRDGVITDVVAQAAVPTQVPVQQYSQSTILPGLIDTHIHFMHWQAPVFLAYGVTTVRDTGNDLQWIIRCREAWPQCLGPRIVCLGPLLDGPKPGHPLVARAINGPDAAVDAVRETLAAGVDGIKLYAAMEPEWIAAMVRESHAASRKVSMHCLAHGVLVAGRAGVDEFYHHDGILADVWPERPPGWLSVWGDPGFATTWERQQQVADAIAQMGMTATPTLAYWDSQWRIRAAVGPTPEEVLYMPTDLFKWSAAEVNRVEAEIWRRALDAAQRFTGLLIERDVPLLAGSDTPCGGVLPGQSLWRELELLVGSGLSVEQALRTATAAAADFLDRPELGRLRPGLAADMICVRGNLLKGIVAQPALQLVMQNGVVYHPKALLEAAKIPSESWRADPWGRQFAWHWAKNSG